MVVTNTDDHLRNRAFILTDKGWILSPLYDVNPVPYGDELSLNVDEEDNRISIDLAVQTAVRFGISKSDAEDYASRFLKNTPSEARQCVYIDRRLHRKITTLVGVAGNRRFTVGNFIDNVLEQHFERHRTEIRSLCSKGLNKIL